MTRVPPPRSPSFRASPAPAVLIVSVVVLGSLAAVPQQGTFHGRVDLVPVYVSVRSGGDLVRGLTSKDFTLADNDVPQEIDELSSERVPIDVTLLIDTSSSVTRSLEVFKADVSRIVRLLQPDEQVRLITFDSPIRQILGMQEPNGSLPVESIRLGDDTSLNDALLFALARAQRPGRRHLLFVFTDGRDTASVLDTGALLSITSRAHAVLHVALVQSNDRPDDSVSAHLQLLSEAAARTGGALYPPSARDTGLVPAFERAIEAFRGSYVLYFSPAGVAREGWHSLQVAVRKPGTYDIRARQGYFAS